MLLIILLYALFASSFSIGKILLGYTQPIFLAGSRMLVGGALLLGYQYFYAHKHFRFQKKDSWYYIQLTLFGIYITYILRFWALRDLSSVKTSFLYNLAPFFSALYSYFFFSEKMTTKQWVGLGIGFIGTIPILLTTSPIEKFIGELYFLSWQEIAVLVSVATHSYSWIIMRKLIRDKSYSPMMVNGISMFAGGLLAIITSFFVEGFFPVTNVVPFASWLMLVVVISNIICYNFYGYLLRTYTVTFLSFAGFLGPMFAALYGWFFLHEIVTWHFYISTVIVLIGLFMFYQDELHTIKQQRDLTP